MTIRVVICDDQAVVSEGLKVILSTSGKINVVGVGSDGVEALELVETYQPDVILLDLKMPVMNGIHATRLIREKFPNTRVLVLTTYDADEWVFDAIRAGASGYLLKDTPRADLIAAIEGTAAGKTHIDPSIAGKLLAQVANTAPPVQSAVFANLSERELSVLRQLARGFNNAEIARRLSLSEGTVRNYVSAILDKLGVDDRTQAAVMALRYGLASDDS